MTQQSHDKKGHAPVPAQPATPLATPAAGRVQFTNRGAIPPVGDGFQDEESTGDLAFADHDEHVAAASGEAEEPATGVVQMKPAVQKKAPAAQPVYAAVKQEKAFKDYVVTPATAPAAYDPIAGKKALVAGDVSSIRTSKAEAEILNKLRAEPKRFNAAALIVAQQKLGVANATGAFNTETLRQLLAKTGNQALTSKDTAIPVIQDEATWKPYNTSGVDLFFAAVEDGPSPKDKPNPRATARADGVAKAMGYADYAALKGTFQSFSFLGVAPVKGKDQAHPHLIARLQAAEAFLKQRFGDQVKPEDFGWQGGLVGAYDISDADIRAGKKHFHTMGLACDFDPSINVWVWADSEVKSQTKAAIKKSNADKTTANATKPADQQEALQDPQGIADQWVLQLNHIMDVAFTQAGLLFKAPQMTKSNLTTWSKTLSTEELQANMEAATAAIESYYKLAKKSGNDQDIVAKFTAAGFSPEQAAEALPEMRKFPTHYDRGFKRANSKGKPVTHSMSLMVALRDAAGLNFGGSELSAGDNGDMMHFDCRNDSMGKQALGAMGGG